jgi:hypothetical protein
MVLPCSRISGNLLVTANSMPELLFSVASAVEKYWSR